MAAAFPDCRHLLDVIGSELCGICGSQHGAKGVMIEVRGCAIHQRCAAAAFETIRRTEICSTCRDFKGNWLMETEKSHDRRTREGWFERYVREPIIDIGCSNDPLTPSAFKYDRIHGGGDATFCQDVESESYQTAYASHILEHVHHPLTAIQNWVRILTLGGRLIVVVPHRDLYEKRQLLPSRWNEDHKSFWLPFTFDPPNTFSLLDTVRQAVPSLTIESVRVLDDGWVSNGDDHSCGEYSIELVARKAA